MSAHTPGPWWVDVHVNVMCKDGLVAFPGIAAGLPQADNARLIAAAPDLLAACQAYIADRAEAGCVAESPAVKAMRAAIAKATGATP